jgi:uncharacterized protein DUF6516
MLGRLSRLLFGDRSTGARFDSQVQVSVGAHRRLSSILRYDNEAGKGDHRHIGRIEKRHKFVDPETLLADFWNDVEA